MRWYLSAIKLRIQDTSTINQQPFLPNTPIQHVPHDIPQFIHFIPFNKPWNDEDVKSSELYAFIDASVHYMDDNPDPRSHIYGNGGGAVTIYYNYQLIHSWMYPISTRNNFNTMELIQFEKIFLIINNQQQHTNLNRSNQSIAI